MLRQTFIHIPGIGKETERSLWSQGCVDWATFLENRGEFNLNGAEAELVHRYVNESHEALERQEHQYFRLRLSASEAWRAWPDFRSSCVYLDIETDGGQQGNAITLIGLYDGVDFKGLVKGVDLENFRDEISRSSMIVSFFGLGFDVPMLIKRFKDVPMDHIHMDLASTLKKIGFRGGLKKIEKQLGWSRGPGIDGLTGLDAIRLWNEYCRGKAKSLEILLEYNRADVVNLERLAEIAYAQLSALTRGETPPPIPGLLEPILPNLEMHSAPVQSHRRRAHFPR